MLVSAVFSSQLVAPPVAGLVPFVAVPVRLARLPLDLEVLPLVPCDGGKPPMWCVCVCGGGGGGGACVCVRARVSCVGRGLLLRCKSDSASCKAGNYHSRVINLQ